MLFFGFQGDPLGGRGVVTRESKGDLFIDCFKVEQIFGKPAVIKANANPKNARIGSLEPRLFISIINSLR